MRIVVAEESALVRAGLGTLLEERGHAVVGETGRAEQVCALVAARAPDALVVDAALPPSFTTEGLRAGVAVRERHPGVGVVVLSRSTPPGAPVPPAAPPAAPGQDDQRPGVLLPARLDDADALDAALRRVVGGGLVVEPPPQGVLGQARSLLEVLTPRERDVLDLMARGLSNRGIAAELKLTTNTVGTHVQHVFDKLGVPDSAAENRRVLAVLTYLNA